MLCGLMKVAGLAASSAVVFPYTTALICNLAYGWPQVPNKFRRAFSPRKVYALNYSIIQSMMVSLRYATLFLQWRSFYKTATASEIMKVNHIQHSFIAKNTHQKTGGLSKEIQFISVGLQSSSDYRHKRGLKLVRIIANEWNILSQQLCYCRVHFHQYGKRSMPYVLENK